MGLTLNKLQNIRGIRQGEQAFVLSDRVPSSKGSAESNKCSCLGIRRGAAKNRPRRTGLMLTSLVVLLVA